MKSASEKFITLDKAEHHTSMRTFDYAKATRNSDYFVLYASTGNLTLNGINNIYPAPSGSVIFLPCSEIINIQNTSGAAVEFNMLCISGMAASLFFGQCPNSAVNVPQYSVIDNICSRLNYLSSSILSDDCLLAAKLIVTLLTEIVFIPKAEEKKPDLLPHVAAVQKLFLDSPSDFYSLNELAAVTHINKYRLVRDFKAQLGITPMQYLLDLRLKTAKKLLSSTNLSVSQISMHTGFSTPNYFIHIFKKKNGLSPTEYRNSR